jgi:creatinine amidohydrolase
MELRLSSWQEIKEYLKSRKDIIIPFGSTEQHGPIGLIGTDSICPEIISRGVAKETGALIAPVLSLGMSQHHLSFPGSIALRPTTLMAVIKDLVYSLAGHGFTHFFFLNGHGGNIHPAQAAFSEIYSDHSFANKPSNLKMELYNWHTGKRVQKVSNTYFKDVDGRHATASELSLSFFAYPDLIRQQDLVPKVAPDSSFTDKFDFAHNFPDGRMGSDSSLASTEIGKQIYEEAVKDTIEEYQKFYTL